MHETEVREMAEKLLNADAVIHEQLLGLEFKSPDRSLMKSRYSADRERGNGGDARDSSAIESKGGEQMGATAAAPNSAGASHAGVKDGASASGSGSMMQARVSNAKVKSMLELLCREAGFLVDSKVRQSIESMTEDDAKVLKAESIIDALGITNEGDLEQLLSYFFSSTKEEDDKDGFDDDDDQRVRSHLHNLKVAKEIHFSWQEHAQQLISKEAPGPPGGPRGARAAGLQLTRP